MKYEQQNIYFIGCTHFYHKNVIRFDNRPFKDIDEMNYELITRWNSVINKNDIVYHLGDLSFSNVELTKQITDQLNGRIHFIMGNHDRMRDIIKLNRFERVYEYGTEIWIKDEDLNKDKQIGYQQMILSHYPILSWNREHYGSWMGHSHCHGSLMKSNPEYYKRKVIDLGSNNIDYTPISYLQVKEIMKTKEVMMSHH